MGKIGDAGNGAVGAAQAVQGMVGVRQHSGLVGKSPISVRAREA